MFSELKQYSEYLSTEPLALLLLALRMRVLHFLPYYVVGLYCEEMHLNSIRRPRLVGVVGILLTFSVCVLVDASYLEHVYFVPSWELTPHLVFFLQYILCGAEVLSVVLLFRSFTSPIFPYTHANSTLAIYEWHWPIIGMISWNEIPFTHTDLPIKPSFFIFLAQHCHPVLTVLLGHVLAYTICVCLGSNAFWRVVRHVSDPYCRGFFVSFTDFISNPKPEKDKCFETDCLLKKQVYFYV